MQKYEYKYTQAAKQLIRVDRLHRAAVEMHIKKLGIHRSQRVMLMYIAQHNSTIQTDIAKALEISPAAVTVTLKKLESSGLIERLQNDNDARANNIVLTGKGMELVKKTGEMFAEVDTAMCVGITEQELDCFVDCINKMTENLKDFSALGADE